jgi:hypothetical protein
VQAAGDLAEQIRREIRPPLLAHGGGR